MLLKTIWAKLKSKRNHRLKIATMLILVGGIFYTAPIHANQHMHGNKNVLTILPSLQQTWEENYNPFSPSSLSTVRHFMFEPLVVFERKNNAKPNFRLAESYKYSPKNIQVTFELRPNLKWSDGRMLSADDVVFTFQMLKEYPFLDTQKLWTKLIGDVVKLNNRKVIFNLKRPNNLAHIKIGEMMIVPMHIWGGIPRADLYLNKPKVGSGPFTEFHYNAGSYTQCRNPNYWDNTSLKIDCIKVPRLMSKDRLSIALNLLEIDWFSVPYQDIEKKFVNLYPQYYGYKLYNDSSVGLLFNYKTKKMGNKLAFADPEFKRAVSMAIKRKSIESIGTYDTSLLLNNMYALPSELLNWYTGPDDISPEGGKEYSKKQIKQLLMANNFNELTGDGWINTPDGSPIHFEISAPSNDIIKLNVARIIKENLRSIGIDASVKSRPEKEYANLIKTGRYEVAIVAWDKFMVPYEFYMHFYSKQRGADYRLSSGFNRWDYDEQMLIYQEHSTKEVVKANQNLVKIFHDTLPMVPLYNEILWHQYSTKNFKGWKQDDIIGSVHQSNPERLLQLLRLEKN